MIKKFRITVDGKVLKEATYEDPAKSGSDRVSTNTISATSSVIVELVDVYGHKYTQNGASGGATSEETTTPETSTNPELPALPSLDEEVAANTAPIITISNPSRSSISVYQGDTFNLRFSAKITTTKRTVSVAINGIPVSTATTGSDFVIPITTDNLPAGNHTATITATNANGKSDSRSFTISVLPK